MGEGYIGGTLYYLCNFCKLKLFKKLFKSLYGLHTNGNLLNTAELYLKMFKMITFIMYILPYFVVC